jgi:hypothetical protein
MIAKRIFSIENKFPFVSLILFCFLCSGLKAQVTVGSDIIPGQAALLDVKDKAPDNNNATTNAGGLGLPRVRLVNRNTLEPFISTSDPEWGTNLNNLKERHAGLTVYNINVTPITNTGKAEEIFRQGVYVWNGSRWKEARSGKKAFFYLPLFNLDLTTDTNPINLYKEYSMQLAGTGDLYAPDELDYVVTYCDTDVLEIKSIDANSDLFYTIKQAPAANPAPTIFITVVVVVK